MITVTNHLSRLQDFSDIFRNHLDIETKHISVVVSEPVFEQDTPDEYHDNGFSVYAALVISSSPISGIMGRQLPVDDLEWEIAYDDLSDLDDKGLVSFVIRNGQVKVWKDNTLTVSDTDPGAHLTYMRVVQLLVNKIQYGFEPYLGSPFPDPSTVEGIIKSAISSVEGFLQVSYQITCYRRLGVISVDLVTEFVGFVQSISVQVELKV
jgi:hypothetical protein